MLISKKAFALPLVLIMILVCSIVGIAAFGLIQSRGEKVQLTFARKQAAVAAESGFNWAVSKLLQDTIGKRWYAFNNGDDCITIADDNSGSTMEVFLCDVFNDRGELSHVHVFCRGSYSIPSSWKSESVICFGRVQVTGDQDNLSAVIMEKRILDTYRFPDLVDSNDDLFSAAENKFASGSRIFFDNATYEEGKNQFLQSVRSRAVNDVDLSDHYRMRPVVALLERYIQLLNEIRIARVANSLLRNSHLADIFKLASETPLSLTDLISTLNAIQGKGSDFSSDRATTLGSDLTRSQRELLITYLLLKRIRELPSTTLMMVRGTRFPPGPGAVRIAGLFYEKVARVSPGNDGIESLFDKMLRMDKRLNEINVMRTFFSIVDSSALMEHQFVPLTIAQSPYNQIPSGGNAGGDAGGTPGGEFGEGTLPDGWSNSVSSEEKVVNSVVPLRDSLIEIARGYDFDSSRIPYGSYEGIAARDDDVSQVEFERSLSTLNVYEPGSGIQQRSEERITKYLNNAVVEDGAEGLHNSAILAGSLGIDDGNKSSFVNLLQESAVSNNIQNLTVYLPSAETESSAEEVGTMVEDIEVATTSIFTENDVVDNPLAELGTSSPLAFGGTDSGGTNPGGANPGGTNPGGVNPGGTNPVTTIPGGANPPATDNSGVIKVDGTDGTDGGTVFIPTDDVAGTTQLLNNILDSYQASNPDSDVVVGINDVTGTSGSGTPQGPNVTVSDTFVQDVGTTVSSTPGPIDSSSLENDYLIANDTPGDDGWVTVGRDLGAPTVTSEPPGAAGSIQLGN